VKSRLYHFIVIVLLSLALFMPAEGIEYRFGTGLSIHGSDLPYDPGQGYNVLMEVGGLSETGHFLGLHMGYSGFLYNANKKLYHIGEIGFSSVLNLAPYRPDPYAVLGVGYSFASEGLDNGAYFMLGLGWKRSLSKGRQFFIQAAVNLGVNNQKAGIANDPGYLYIPITIGLNFYAP